MSAFIELAKFCEQHPEIRSHKKIGGLLNDVAAEFAQLHEYIDKLEGELAAEVSANIKLRAEIDHYSEVEAAYQLAVHEAVMATKERNELRAENAEMREALEYYVDRGNNGDRDIAATVLAKYPKEEK